MTKTEIITLIEGTGLYLFKEEKTIAKEKYFYFVNDFMGIPLPEQLHDLTIPANITAARLIKVLDRTFSLYYKSKGKIELQTEIKKILGFFI